jgi:hypothetical protein
MRQHRPIVHILAQQPGIAGAAAVPADKADGIDVEHQGRRAARIIGLGEEHMGHAEGQIEGLVAIGMLVQQEPQIAGRPMCGGQGEQHRAGLIRRVLPRLRISACFYILTPELSPRMSPTAGADRRRSK